MPHGCICIEHSLRGPCTGAPLSPKSWLEKCWVGLKSCNLPPRHPPAPSSTPSTASPLSLTPIISSPPPPTPPRHSPPSAPPLLTPAQPTSPLPLPPWRSDAAGGRGQPFSRGHSLNVPLGPASDTGAGLTSGSAAWAGRAGLWVSGSQGGPHTLEVGKPTLAPSFQSILSKCSEHAGQAQLSRSKSQVKT